MLRENSRIAAADRRSAGSDEVNGRERREGEGTQGGDQVDGGSDSRVGRWG